MTKPEATPPHLISTGCRKHPNITKLVLIRCGGKKRIEKLKKVINYHRYLYPHTYFGLLRNFGAKAPVQSRCGG